ncbi:hypothetical protein KLMA_10820 [Kluyveromyces marxianus]|uniref:Uncharacterized protein n=2 Tax=Kluyveromyces marxianus TaxID=4911 RepID=W0T4C0_KLUMD|nr:hypothetical protein KLMA_10820 [Kluyveromyces marxianus DMKU3-1042]QGN13384.1 protein UBS1 [Kluyveromyces marxianus]BAO38442.1 hypothetical protein KLMA_10820 [Kluyveromyces marxianus DMKU3-1042]BAP69995.1 hypothetical protein KLMA_10820 [Kluyveromyces marxianus]
MHQLYRKLLREWRRLSHDKCSQYCIKPQESNLQFWNMVLHDERWDLELYCVVFISHKQTSEYEPIILLSCLTPNPCIPINKAICLNHLSPVLLNYGLVSFYEHLLSSIFERCSGILDSHRRLALAWNRLMIKDFKHNFPTLFSTFSVTQMDAELVNDYVQSQTISIKKNGPNSKSNAENSRFVNTTTEQPIMNMNSQEGCTEQLFMTKRQRIGVSSYINVNPVPEPNDNALENFENCYNLEDRKRKI